MASTSLPSHVKRSSTLGHLADTQPSSATLVWRLIANGIERRYRRAIHIRSLIMKHYRNAIAAAALTLLTVSVATTASAQMTPESAAGNVVVVHGALADGSGWKKVSDILSHDGYKVTIVQEPETTLADDAAA